MVEHNQPIERWRDNALTVPNLISILRLIWSYVEPKFTHAVGSFLVLRPSENVHIQILHFGVVCLKIPCQSFYQNTIFQLVFYTLILVTINLPIKYYLH